MFTLDGESVITGLQTLGLVTRNSGGDILDMDGNVTTTAATLRDFGVVLDQGSISSAGLNVALENFAREGMASTDEAAQSGMFALRDLSGGLSDLEAAGLPTLDDLATGFQALATGQQAVDAGSAAFAAGITEAAAGSILATTGITEMDDAVLDASSILDEMGLSSVATVGDLEALSLEALDLTGTLGLLGGDGAGAGAGLETTAAGADAATVGISPLIVAVGALVVALIPVAGVLAGVIGGSLGAIAEVVAGVGGFALVAAKDLSGIESQIKSTFDTWDQGIQDLDGPAVKEALSGIPTLFGTMLNDLTPLVEGSVKGMDSVLESVGQDLQSSDLQQFFVFLGQEVPSALMSANDAFQGWAAGFSKAIETSQPWISMLESGFVSLSQDVENFSTSNTFKDFIAWLIQNAPVVEGDVKEIGDDVGHLLTNLVPLGMGLLNVFTTVSNGVRDVLTPLGDFGHDLADVGTALTGNVSSSSEWNTVLAESHAKMQDQITDLAAVIEGTSKLSDAQLEAATQGTTFASAIAAQAKAAQDEANAGYQGIDAVGTALSGLVSGVKTDFDSWTSSANEADVGLKKVSQDVTGLGTATGSAFAGATSIVSAFSGQVSVTGSQIQNFYDTSVAGAQTFTSNIQKAIQDGYNPQLIAQLLEAGPAQAGPILQGLVSNASASFVSEVNASAAALSQISQEEIDQASLTQQAINTTNAQTKADYSTAMTILAQIAADGGHATVEQLSTQLGLGQGLISTVVGQYSSVFSGGMVTLGTDGTTGGSTAGANVASGISSQTGAVSNSAEAVVAAAKGAFTTVDWSQIGVNIDLGIAAGIAAQGGTVATAAGSMVAKALSDAKSAAGITSPSTVFRDEVGVPIGQGVALGLANTESDVVSAAQHLMSSALEAMLGAAPSVGGSPDGPGLPGISEGSSEVDAGIASIAAAQMAQIASVPVASAPIVPVGAGSSSSTFHLTVNAPSGDAQAIAATVRQELDSMVSSAHLALTASGRRP